jgi:hypothetical protein
MQLRRWLEVLDQPKLVDGADTPILDGVHALPNKMQTETARLNFVEATAAQLCGIDGGTVVAEQNFEAVGLLGRPRGHTATTEFDGLICPSVIAMAHDIGQSFVDRARDGAPVGRRKPEDLGEAFKRATHDKQQFRIAKQFEFQ